MKRSMRAWRTGSGTEPSSSTVSWKRRMSKRAPSARSARARAPSRAPRAGGEARERDRAELERGVVEAADVEARAECAFGPGPRLFDGHLAEIVRQGLA